jgi:hypothetical protein
MGRRRALLGGSTTDVRFVLIGAKTSMMKDASARTKAARLIASIRVGNVQTRNEVHAKHTSSFYISIAPTDSISSPTAAS